VISSTKSALDAQLRASGALNQNCYFRECSLKLQHSLTDPLYWVISVEQWSSSNTDSCNHYFVMYKCSSISRSTFRNASRSLLAESMSSMIEGMSETSQSLTKVSSAAFLTVQ
jgi:hypothetical protein